MVAYTVYHMSAGHQIRIHPYPIYRSGLTRIETFVIIHLIQITFTNPNYGYKPRLWYIRSFLEFCKVKF
jgi:hypothetical protein